MEMNEKETDTKNGKKVDNVKDKNEDKELESEKNKKNGGKQPGFNIKVRFDVIKSIIDVTHAVVDDVKFSITSKGISLRTYDHAHIAMVDMNIKNTAFEEYIAEDMELGININKLSEIIKLAGSDDIILLNYDENKNQIIITIDNLIRSLGLIDIAEMSDIKMPALDLPARAIVGAGDLSRGLRASEMISDHFALTLDVDRLELYAKGEVEIVKLTLSKDMLIDINSPGKYRSLFSIDYFNKMIKAVKNTELITICLGKDNPLKVDFDFADGNGHVTYLLAPRIDSE